MLANVSPAVVKLLSVAGILTASILVGLLFQKVLVARAHRAARRTAMPWDDILVASISGYIIVWFLLIGLAVIFKVVHLRPETLKVLQRAIGVIGILSAVSFGVRLSKKAIEVYVDRFVDVPTSIFKNAAVIVIYLLGFVISLDYLGVSVTALVTAMGVGGLGVALALQETFTNMISGLNILMTKKIRPGDFVQIDGDRIHEGNVTDITWRSTTIRGPDNNLIIIPNSKLGQAVVTNVHLPEKEMGLFVPVAVGYDNDLRAVERMTVEVAREVLADPDRGVPGFEPRIRFNAFTELGVQFNVILRVREFTDQFALKHDFFLRLHDRYRKEGVSFPIPARTVRVEKE
jgi:small-conductance mechanosensitive channel